MTTTYTHKQLLNMAKTHAKQQGMSLATTKKDNQEPYLVMVGKASATLLVNCVSMSATPDGYKRWVQQDHIAL